MKGRPKLYSFFLVEIAAAISVMGLGCAAPIVPATNVVMDGEVRGCAPDILDGLGSLDVAIVIDTSQSTRRPTGFDIDGDGRIHSFQRDRAIDLGDSRLAAQVAAIRPLLRGAADPDVRFSIVTFSGPSIERTVGRTQLTPSVRDSSIRAELTNDTARLDSVLDDLLARGSDGMTIFSAGMGRATHSLLGHPNDRQNRRRRKLVLFMSDSPRPYSLDVDGNLEEVDPRMKNAAILARGQGIVFHTFGLSPDSRQWRREALGQIAGATGGTYHPIEDPRHFYCHLAHTLIPPHQPSHWKRAFAMNREGWTVAPTGTGSSQPIAPRE